MQNFLHFTRKYLKDVIFGLLLISSIGISLYSFFYHYESADILVNDEVAVMPKEEKEEVTKETIHIDVKGAVKKPGVYEIEKNSIVQDVITLAGGFNSNAYKNGINLSKKVVDEMVLYIYTTSEVKTNTSNTNITVKNETTTCNTPTYSIVECVENKESVILPGESSTTNDKNSTVSTIININTASLKELTSLSGIGESKAKLIITYREANGKFKSIEDIKKVKGIGDAIFEKIKNSITV